MKLNYPIIATLMLGGFALVNIAVIWHATPERTGTAEGAVSGPKPALAERPKQSATAAAANTPADESKQKKTGSQGQTHQPARSNKNEKAAGALPGTKVQPGTSQSRPGIQDRYARAEVLDTRMVTDLQNPLVRTRIRLVKTDFKYPLLRVVDKLHASRNGEEEKLVQQSTMVADHVMVKLNKGFTDDDLQRAIKPFGGRVRKKFPITKNYLIEIPEATMDSVEKTLLQLQVPAVSVAEPDYIVRATLMPDDEKFSQLWGMHNTGQTGGTGDADIDAPEAWNLSTGSRNVLVGVIDTGVDYTHPDLAPNMWTNTHEIPGNGVDDDANGYVDDTRGWDFYNVDNNPMDDHFHGTHCAGTIGAVGGNGVGVAGVCWHVSLVGLKFLNKDGGGTTSDAAEATAYATRIGVDLTSNSWGGTDYNTALADAISAANDEGVLFVAAAGNDGVSNDEESNYPSNYDYPNVIAVAASDHADNLTNFSNYGVTQVDLAAPGKNILSCTIGGGYLSVSGTSMATPHVAGACALLKAYRPELAHLAVRDIVIHSGDARPELADTIASGRRLNLSNALDFHELTFSPTTPFVASGPNGGPFSPTSRTFTITNHAQTPQTWTVAKNATWLDLSEAGGTLGPGTSTNIIVSVNSWASDLPQGIYEDALTVTNVTTGRSSQCSFTLYAGSPDFYTEEFDAASNALDPHEYDFQRFVFTPDSTQKTYSVYRSSVTGFNTDPTGGTAIDLVPTGLGAELLCRNHFPRRLTAGMP